MMNISGMGAATARYSMPLPSRNENPQSSGFGEQFAKASGQIASGSMVTISPQASAAIAALSSAGTVGANPASKNIGATSSLGIDAAFFQKANTATYEDRKTMYAEAARSVSASQGLPEGQYDFTRLTPNQMLAVNNDMIVNRGSEGFYFPMATEDPSAGELSVQTDYVSMMRNAYEFCTNYGALDAAKAYKDSLDLMTKLSPR